MNEPPEDAAAANVDSAFADHASGTGNGQVQVGQQSPTRALTAQDLGFPPRPRRRFLPLFLFVATCISTFWAGTTDWEPLRYVGHADVAGFMLRYNWQQGLIYMAAVIGILLTHELGHFLQTVRYHVPASYPIFIPVPFLMTGTMGAVIGMEGSRANRRQLFDIGVTGPLVGLAVALPVLWYGIKSAAPEPVVSDAVLSFGLGKPLIFHLLTHYLRPELSGVALQYNPLLMAGWVGMLITGLNMLPVSQLDGGHVIYGLWGRRAHWVARGFVLVAVAYMVMVDQYTWTLMFTLILLLGVDHPPTSDDSVRLGPVRQVIGLASLAIPILCFTPNIVP